MKKCHVCSRELEFKVPVGRQETCPFCMSDLRCCRNCSFFVTGSYNECREPQAERVIEKGRSNFCEYFVFRNAAADARDRDIQATAKARLEALFKMD